ncbi:cell division cycle-associated protein 7a [Denticeps clupeoides]|uniref:Zinc-finger domain-containing protein n=1 Tax=Denticeps clupeoides TaxID=299321 RepID=A0AAY4ETB7_9TELE|nr:cell division cycle-associated protein 7 [Denticeps clupeoides]
MRSKKQQQQQQQPASVRRNLRSYRNQPLVAMETSSSDDSCDSFGSDGYANTRKALVRTRGAPGRGRPLESSSEEDTRSISEEMDAMMMDADVDLVESKPKTRAQRCSTLKVAMKFPAKKSAAKKPSPPAKDPESDSEEGENFMIKRALNIKENKAMLAKLMAEINKVPGLFPRRAFTPAGSTPQRSPRRPLGAPGGRRRNTERLSRIHTRSRSRVDGPPGPPPEEESEDKFALVRRVRAAGEDEEEMPSRRRGGPGPLAIPHVVRPVEEVTQEELDNICVTVRDKVYNSASGSTCHQCRQKTTDTKTNCRNPECVGVRGQFCGPCLRNRYGEEVRDALLDPAWRCPPCRGICNCSFCRAREGRCATGVLVYLAKYHGFDNVHAYLRSLRKELEDAE